MTIARRGFTVLELITVLAMVGILTAIALPKIEYATASMSLRSAKQEVAAYLARARAAAIQNGRTASFIRSGNTIAVAIDTGTGPINYSSAHDLFADHGVTVAVSPAQDTIQFDPRGIAAAIDQYQAIVLTKDDLTDSVCVIGRGRISTKDCSL